MSEAGELWPTDGWATATPEELGMDSGRLEDARDFALQGGGSGIVTRGGRLVFSWGSLSETYKVRSTTKSFGAALLGLAIRDGRVDLDDRAQTRLADFGTPPASNESTGDLDDITLLQLATHAAGFETKAAFGSLVLEPGTAFLYSDGGANWLGDVLTVAFGEDLLDVLRDRVLTPLGLPSGLTWRTNVSRPITIQGIPRREIGSGIRVNVDLMARFGYLHLRQGVWDGEVILPSAFVDELRSPHPSLAGVGIDDPANFPNANEHYGLLWWNNGDGSIPGVPLDAYWSWGLDESLIVVIPSLDIVVARAGPSGFRVGWNSDYSAIAPFLTAIVDSVQDAGGNRAPLVDAGPDQAVSVTDGASLEGSASDDGIPFGALTTTWSVVSGPGAATLLSI